MLALPTDVLVAFSTRNGGTFYAKDKQPYPEVCPDHALDDRVNEILIMRAKNAKVEDFSLSEAYRTKLAEHLVKIHKPFQAFTTISDKPYKKSAEAIPTVKVEQKTSEYIVNEKPKPNSIMGGNC